MTKHVTAAFGIRETVGEPAKEVFSGGTEATHRRHAKSEEENFSVGA